MSQNSIKVYGRIKPPSNSEENEGYKIHVSPNEEHVKLTLSSRCNWDNSPIINNRPETHTFQFTKIIEHHAGQEEVFNVVALPVVKRILEGYNGTIFAYGQTGSGKTYTITGGTEGYHERGIIPRAIQYIFNAVKREKESVSTVNVSYLEIYNECGFDLLDPQQQVSKLDDLPRVTLLEDSEGNTHLRHLSINPVQDEEDALNLLFIGDTNRTIGETEMNAMSSRSHCIFTIHFSTRKKDSSVVRKSKLHLVDLAGSERLYKTSMNGRHVIEARHINLTLHYLEQVIVALSESGRLHVPYRNCMMTTVLKDSLGGNSLTAMVATLSLKKTNIEETLSTCRFAQRVAMVSNQALLNMEQDPNREIELLRAEIKFLRNQVQLLTGNEFKEELNPSEIFECKNLIEKFVRNDNTSVMELPSDMRKIRLCFQLLKDKIPHRSHRQNGVTEAGLSDILYRKNEEISQLKRSMMEKSTSRCRISRRESENITLSRPKWNVINSPSTSIVGTKAGRTTQMVQDEVEDFKRFVNQRENTAILDSMKFRLKQKCDEHNKSEQRVCALRQKIDYLQMKLDGISCVSGNAEHRCNNKSNEIRIIEKVTLLQLNYEEQECRLKRVKSEICALKEELQEIIIMLVKRFRYKRANSEMLNQKFSDSSASASDSKSLNQGPSEYRLSLPRIIESCFESERCETKSTIEYKNSKSWSEFSKETKASLDCMDSFSNLSYDVSSDLVRGCEVVLDIPERDVQTRLSQIESQEYFTASCPSSCHTCHKPGYEYEIVLDLSEKNKPEQGPRSNISKSEFERSLLQQEACVKFLENQLDVKSSALPVIKEESYSGSSNQILEESSELLKHYPLDKEGIMDGTGDKQSASCPAMLQSDCAPKMPKCIGKRLISTKSENMGLVDMNSLPLTGDLEIDDVIISFYKNKNKDLLRKTRNLSS